MDNLLNTVLAKIKYGVRLTDAEALELFACDDLLAIGELAALANARLNDARVYYNVNRHINYTNLCVNRCTFCAFSREADEAGCYTLALDDLVAFVVGKVLDQLGVPHNLFVRWGEPRGEG